MATDTARLLALLKAATPRPWEFGGVVRCECGSSSNCWHQFEAQAEIFPPLGESGPVAVVSEREHANAELIAEAVNALPGLIEENERLRDLVLYARLYLHEEGLLDEKQYAALADSDSGQLFTRLEGYDAMRKDNERLRAALNQIRNRSDLDVVLGRNKPEQIAEEALNAKG